MREDSYLQLLCKIFVDPRRDGENFDQNIFKVFLLETIIHAF